MSDTPAERTISADAAYQRRYAERQKEAGKRRFAVWLSAGYSDDYHRAWNASSPEEVSLLLGFLVDAHMLQPLIKAAINHRLSTLNDRDDDNDDISDHRKQTAADNSGSIRRVAPQN